MRKIACFALQNTRLLNKSLPIFRFSSRKVQYFDYQATTQTDYRVLDAMMPFLTQQYGNPHSKTHQFGWDSSSAI